MAETVLQLRKAQRSKAFFKLGISGPPGSGKTMGALIVGYGLLREAYPDLSDEEIWSRIAVVDTEHGSGELYVGTTVGNIRIGEYLVATLDKPFTVEKFITAMDLCLQADVEVCILDSTSHLWAGSGGLLEQQQDEAKRGGNSYTAWRKITPQYDSFINKILQAPMHVIATMRAKPEYVIEKDSGRTQIRRVGLEPVQRKGIDFEFTTFFELNFDHEAYVSKDRTNLLDGQTLTIVPETGKIMMRWLKSGTNAEKVVVDQLRMANPEESLKEVQQTVVKFIKELGGSKNKKLMDIIKRDEYAPSGNTNSIKDKDKLNKLLGELQAMKDELVVGNSNEDAEFSEEELEEELE